MTALALEPWARRSTWLRAHEQSCPFAGLKLRGAFKCFAFFSFFIREPELSKRLSA